MLMILLKLIQQTMDMEWDWGFEQMEWKRKINENFKPLQLRPLKGTWMSRQWWTHGLSRMGSLSSLSNGLHDRFNCPILRLQHFQELQEKNSGGNSEKILDFTPNLCPVSITKSLPDCLQPTVSWFLRPSLVGANNLRTCRRRFQQHLPKHHLAEQRPRKY